MEQNQEQTGLSPEARARLMNSYIEKLNTRTAEEATVLAEVLMEILYREEPLLAPSAISTVIESVTGQVVPSEEILQVMFYPSRSRLTDDQESLVSSGTLLYGLYKAAKALHSSGEEVTLERVFAWMKELVERYLLQGSLLDVMAKYREQSIAVLSELAKS